MHELIYVSEAQGNLAPDEIFQIIEQSARNNPSAGITGFLIYRGGRFLQLVEGELNALDALLAKLRLDPRHHSLQVLATRPIAERSFPRWWMKRVGESEDALSELRRALAMEGRSEYLAPQVGAFLQRGNGPPVSSAAA
jgi:hypothetical protein